jgi:hypothetical protein
MVAGNRKPQPTLLRLEPELSFDVAELVVAPGSMVVHVVWKPLPLRLESDSYFGYLHLKARIELAEIV